MDPIVIVKFIAVIAVLMAIAIYLHLQEEKMLDQARRDNEKRKKGDKQ